MKGTQNLQYILNRLPIGLILLDKEYRVVSFNDIASEILGPEKMLASLGKPVHVSHPPKAKNKIKWLLNQATEKGTSEFVSMLINIPEMVLQLRMIKIIDGSGISGFCMLCYDITDLTFQSDEAAKGTRVPRPMHKLPISEGGRIALLDVEHVTYLQADGHYTQVHTADRSYFCNLSLAQLESRLTQQRFIRVHRSFIVNIDRATGIYSRGDSFAMLMEGEPEQDVPVSRTNAPKVRQLLGV